MKKKFTLALVGRPNVGKSSLFNRICGKRISIVAEEEGVTRDRLYGEASFLNEGFQVIDTGGIVPSAPSALEDEIKRQAQLAIREADVVVFVVDGRVGPTLWDQEVASLLLHSQKPLLLAVNKLDNGDEGALSSFYSLGIQKMVAVSAVHGLHIAELLEMALEERVEVEKEEETKKALSIALLGRPNVGKSTLLNSLVNESRSIVSPIAGTTRDSIAASVQFQEKEYVFIDTAGVRKKSSEHSSIEKFASIRTEEAIERADICLLLLDAVEGVSIQEKKMARKIEQLGKGCLCVFNKWDLMKNCRMEHYLQSVRSEVPLLDYCPILFISAKTGRNREKIFPLMDGIQEQLNRRLSTSQLNQFLKLCVETCHPPMIQGKRLHIYYATQVSVQPPSFVLFVNKSTLMEGSYQKYLENQFRKTFGFLGVPLHFALRGKGPRDSHLHKDTAN